MAVFGQIEVIFHILNHPMQISHFIQTIFQTYKLCELFSSHLMTKHSNCLRNPHYITNTIGILQGLTFIVFISFIKTVFDL